MGWWKEGATALAFLAPIVGRLGAIAPTVAESIVTKICMDVVGEPRDLRLAVPIILERFRLFRRDLEQYKHRIVLLIVGASDSSSSDGRTRDRYRKRI